MDGQIMDVRDTGIRPGISLPQCRTEFRIELLIVSREALAIHLISLFGLASNTGPYDPTSNARALE
jgi:hypothetical protein